jgi:saccharopine dehydrogenase-like NADP-dependent oxidoreductase
MKILCLGGAGKICREAVKDLAQFSDFRRITIADVDESEGRRLVNEIAQDRVDYLFMDITDHNSAVAGMRGYDIVMDGTTIALNGKSTACIAAAGCHGINLNGFGEEYSFDAVFKQNGNVHVPGFGMTPGVTDMMLRHAADQMDRVDTVRVSHGAFRPIAFSPAITETTTYEYDPQLPGRVVFENGRFIQVPPFARQRDIALPKPYGTHPQWIIPHAETRTAHAYLKDKGVRLIEVRGTWPPETMRLVRTLYDWGFLNNAPVRVNGQSVPVMQAIAAFLQQSPQGQTTDLYGYALHVQVIGTREGRWVEHVLTHTHPPSDGSVPGWKQLRAYTRNVGIPMAIGADLIARGKVSDRGVIMPEFAFDPQDVFEQLALREIEVHEKIRYTTPPPFAANESIL